MPSAAPQSPQGQGQRGGVKWGQVLMRIFFMYMMYNTFTKPKVAVDRQTGRALPPHRNSFAEDQLMDLRVYITEDEHFESFDNQSSVVWEEKNIAYSAAPVNGREKNITVFLSENVKNNGSIWAHIFFTKAGSSITDPSATISRHAQLNSYLVKKEEVKKNLLGGTTQSGQAVVPTESPDIASGKTTIQSYWKPTLVLNLIPDWTAYPNGQFPPHVAPLMRLDEHGYYYPMLYVNEFWLLREYLTAINETVESVPLALSYSPLAMWKLGLYMQMEASWDMQNKMGTISEGEQDDLKRMFLETNVYLLALTMVVTVLHMIFDFLAFSSDISFWKNSKSMEGLSVRSIFINAGSQLVIFLYLLDNDTSWMILLSSGIGVLIEMWKIKKACTISVNREGRFPRIQFEDKASYASKTKEFDIIAMRYLSYALYPLVIGYSIYSLVYETHKSWYSWILSSLTGTVYTFGFITMTPQLWINYKLKSTAHLPWKTFTYKALNTFIDDLFAFIIKMPTLHRISCFRDDVIFFIFLYQKWIYPVDKTRVNEFGQGGEDGKEEVEQEDADQGERLLTNGDAASSEAADSESSTRRRKKGPRVGSEQAVPTQDSADGSRKDR